MMIFETEYKGTKAIQLENEKIKTIILPYMGGKIASLFSKEKDFELIFQNKEALYRKASLFDNFADYDASGFDDAFPSINTGTVKIGDKEIEYPDHGEIWSGNFSYKVNEERVELHFKSAILPYYYTKFISLKKDRLLIQYEIENIGTEAFPCIWAAHFLVNCDETMELLLPKETREVINVLDSKFLGDIGTVHNYPVTLDAQGNEYKLNRIFPKAKQKCEKFYINEEITEGKCGIYYPNHKLTYNLYFDNNIFPYLGFWVTEGGFRGDYNCALEPTNGFYDSIETAQKEVKIFVLKAGDKLSFNMEIEIL